MIARAVRCCCIRTETRVNTTVARTSNENPRAAPPHHHRRRSATKRCPSALAASNDTHSSPLLVKAPRRDTWLSHAINASGQLQMQRWFKPLRRKPILPGSARRRIPRSVSPFSRLGRQPANRMIRTPKERSTAMSAARSQARVETGEQQNQRFQCNSGPAFEARFVEPHAITLSLVGKNRNLFKSDHLLACC